MIINYINRLRKTQAKIDRDSRITGKRKEIEKLKQWKKEHINKHKS